MTCIAGIAQDGAVYLGGDSAGVSDWDLEVRADAKVFANGPYVMGFTGSWRLGQLLRYSLSPPAPEAGDLFGFMCTAFVDAVRNSLKDGGWASKNNEQESGGQFLVGVGGRLFEVHSDYQVAEFADGYYAIGCGFQAARGALFATASSGLKPPARLELALRAAEHLSAGVRGPFTFASVKGETAS